MPADLWCVPLGLWTGEPGWIIGGGPSLKGFDVNRLRGRGRVFVTNNAYLLAPWADVLYFNDRKWFEQPNWHCRDPELRDFRGHIVTQASVGDHYLPIKRLKPTSGGLSRDAGRLSGWCSGGRAINLAYLFGCDPIILLGFDMRSNGNWHEGHKTKPEPDVFRKVYIPAIEAMAVELRNEGRRVINATPDSALQCFETADIEDLLA